MPTQATGGSTAQPTPVRSRRMSSRRLLLWIVLFLAVCALLFFGYGGWHFSNVIRNDVFEVHHDPDRYDLTVESVGTSSITLSGDDDLLEQPGVLGLAWDGGYTQVGEVIQVGDGGEAAATRRLMSDAMVPATGAQARLDPSAYEGDPMTVFSYPFTEVTYESPTGDLGAWYLRGSGTTWMIFVHGRGADRDQALRLMPLAFERSYHILVIDYRNDLNRGTDPSGWYQYGRTEWEDVAAAARYAREHGAERFVLVGYSMGGAAVVNFLARSPLRNQAIAAVLDSPVLDLEAVVDSNIGQTSLGIGPWTVPSSLASVAEWMASWRFDIDWDRYDAIDLWRDLHTPMLILHGTADATVPLQSSERLEQTRRDIVTLVTFDGVGHVLGWNADRERYEAAITTFLDSVGV